MCGTFWSLAYHVSFSSVYDDGELEKTSWNKSIFSRRLVYLPQTDVQRVQDTADLKNIFMH